MKLDKKLIFAVILLSLLAVLFLKLKTEQKSPEVPEISNPQTEASGLSDMLASLNMSGFTETKKAPEFALTSLEGEKISLSQFHGKAVMLNFWSTW